MICVEHSAFPNPEKRIVYVERRVFKCGEVLSRDYKALTPEDAIRLAEAIRSGCRSDYFHDAQTGETALYLDYATCEYYDLTWDRGEEEDAHDSLWDTEWPDAWADEIENAAREVMK